MTNMTKKQRNTLLQALSHLDRGIQYLYGDRIAVARKEPRATTTLHYSRADGAALYEVAKEYGSDLTGIQEARRILSAFLDPAS